MDETLTNAYRALNEVQRTVQGAQTLDEALQEGLRIILRGCGVSSGIIWYLDDQESGVIHPYFWIGCPDLTSSERILGEGMVGRVCQTQHAERALTFSEADDPQTAADFGDMVVKSTVCVPFDGGDAVFGCIQFVNKEGGGTFTEDEAEVFAIVALVAGMAIQETEELQPAWTHGPTAMRIRGVTREFVNGDEVTKVLRGVNLDVFEGEFLVLLGESGCGKSTLLNIIGGLDQPNSGSIEVFGQELSRASQKQLTEYRRDNIGFIFQNYNLMPNLTAKQNIELFASLVSNPMTSDEALRIVNLEERQNNYPSQMSGGQQQRVSIARALMKRPRIILADEPTAALDYATSIEVLEVMEKIVGEGTTMVMVTHNEEICRMADRVVRMRDGRVNEVMINRRKAHATELTW